MSGERMALGAFNTVDAPARMYDGENESRFRADLRQHFLVLEAILGEDPLGPSGSGSLPIGVAVGDLLYGSAVDTWSRRAVGSAGDLLRVVSGLPAWAATIGYTNLPTGGGPWANGGDLAFTGGDITMDAGTQITIGALNANTFDSSARFSADGSIYAVGSPTGSGGFTTMLHQTLGLLNENQGGHTQRVNNGAGGYTGVAGIVFTAAENHAAGALGMMIRFNAASIGGTANTARMRMTALALSPESASGITLGTAALPWGSAFLGTTLVGAASGATGTPRLDVSGGVAIAITDTLSDATDKVGRFGVRHYTNAEETVSLLVGHTTPTTSLLRIGGGSSLQNAMTQILFYTAANNTTTIGTIRGIVNASGNWTFGSVDGTGTGNLVMAALTATSATLSTSAAVVLTAAVPVIGNSVGTARVVYAGGTQASPGGNLNVFGATHATQANDIELRSGANVKLAWDDSAAAWSFQSLPVSMAALTATTGTFSVEAIASHSALGAATGTGLHALNPTLSTSGAQSQWSPRLRFSGHAWNVGGGVDVLHEADIYLEVTGGLATSEILQVVADTVRFSGVVTVVGSLSSGALSASTGAFSGDITTSADDIVVGSGVTTGNVNANVTINAGTNSGSNNKTALARYQFGGTDYWLLGMNGSAGLEFALRNEGSGFDIFSVADAAAASTTVFFVETGLKVGFDVEIDGALNHDGTTVGFYGTAPISKQTGVAVTAAGVHAALVNLGLISA